MKIVLIGFMGSGKSSIASELSKKLNHQLIEMDAVVFERTGTQNMNQVFEKGGETLLREWEIQLAKEWRTIENTVISTGGGVVMNKIILDYLKENNGKVVYLHAPFTEIAKRIEKDSTVRPLFKDLKTAEDLYSFRLPLYRRYSDLQISTENKSITEIVDDIINHINL